MPVTVNGISCTLAGGVRETTQTTGTGTMSLDGAATVDGITYRTFVAGVGSGTTTVYTRRSGSQFETGIGTVTSGAPATLTRSSILESSNSNNAVNWGAGVHDIFLDAAAAVFHSIQTSVDAVDTALGGLTDLRATQSTTSGTAKNFTSIGSTAYRITVMFRDLGRNGSDRVHIQLGDSGGYETTGYQGGIGHMDDTDFQVTNLSAVGFPLLDSVSMGSTATLSGQLILTHMGGNIWTASGGAARTDALDAMIWYGGMKALSGTLTDVRLLAIDTLNSGTIAIRIDYAG